MLFVQIGYSWRKGYIRKLNDLMSILNYGVYVGCYGFPIRMEKYFQKFSVVEIQLPASFKENEENIKNAEKFFSKIERDEISVSLELRGWGKEGFKSLCKKFDLISCVDPFASEPVYFSSRKIAYFRLHGSYEKGRINYKYKFTDKDLQELKKLLKD